MDGISLNKDQANGIPSKRDDKLLQQSKINGQHENKRKHQNDLNHQHNKSSYRLKHSQEKSPKIGKGKQPTTNSKLKGSVFPSRQIKKHPSSSPQSSVQLSLPNQLPPFVFERPILNPASASAHHFVSPESTEIHQLGKEVDDDTGDDDNDKEGDDGKEKKDEDEGDDDDDEDDDNEDDDEEEEDEEDDDDDDDEDDDEDDDDEDDDDEDEDEDTVDEYITEGEEDEIYFGVATTNPIITSYLEGYGLAAGHAEDEIQGLGLIGVFEPYKVSAASKSNHHLTFTILISIALCWLLFIRRN